MQRGPAVCRVRLNQFRIFLEQFAHALDSARRRSLEDVGLNAGGE